MTITAKMHIQNDDGSDGWGLVNVERFQITVDGVDFDLMMTYSRSASDPDAPACQKVSDYKTGWSFLKSNERFIDDLFDEKVYCPTNEQIGERVIAHCVEKYGMDKVLSAIASKPVLNEV